MRLKYLPALDGIRACAFGLVFLAHAGLERIVPGGMGVTIFFFLSGYLITTLLRVEWTSTGSISISGFYKRRAMRILPPLYLVMLIFWLLDWFHVPDHIASGYGLLSVVFYFYNYAALLNHGFTDIVPVGLNVVWSLMIEEHFYLVFPFFFLFAKKRGMTRERMLILLTSTCAAVLLWRCILVFHFHTSLTSPFSWTYGATDARFDSILWGCILAIGFNPWYGDTHRLLDQHRGTLAIAGLLLILFSVGYRESHFRETLRYSLQGIALLPIFYYIVSDWNGRLGKALSWRPLRWLGWVSYTMYLVHFATLDILHDYLKWNPWLIALCAFCISGIFAELVRLGIEIPLREMKRRKHLEVAATP